MRKFIITSPRFTGQAELLYNPEGILCMIDCTKTGMEEATVAAFKKAVPAGLAALLDGSGFSAETTVVEAGFVVSFKRFYDEYPWKRNKFRAEKVWDKMSSAQQVKAFYSITGYKKYLHRTSVFAMGADKYLSDRHYETDWNVV